MIQQSDSDQQGLQELREFIDSNPDPRAQKRALVITMLIEGFPGSSEPSMLICSS